MQLVSPAKKIKGSMIMYKERFNSIEVAGDFK